MPFENAGRLAVDLNNNHKLLAHRNALEPKQSPARLQVYTFHIFQHLVNLGKYELDLSVYRCATLRFGLSFHLCC